MIQLTKALNSWGTAEFEGILKKELEELGAKDLPLQQGLSTSNYALDNNLSVMILSVSEQANFIHAKVGIFYTGIMGGCSCADDPTPVGENNEYCEMQVDIDKTTAETTVVLLPD